MSISTNYYFKYFLENMNQKFMTQPLTEIQKNHLRTMFDKMTIKEASESLCVVVKSHKFMRGHIRSLMIDPNCCKQSFNVFWHKEFIKYLLGILPENHEPANGSMNMIPELSYGMPQIQEKLPQIDRTIPELIYGAPKIHKNI